MPKTETIAASVKDIKAAYPKASNDFVVKCMEEEMSMEEVQDAAVKAMEEENEELMAKVSAMEEEIESLRAKISAMEEEPEAMEEEPAAKGSEPVAVSTKPRMSASAEWQELIDANVAKGMSRFKAVQAANRAKPGLRELMIQEVNA